MTTKTCLQVTKAHAHHVTWTLNRPQARHALNPELIEALTCAVTGLDAKVRTVVICAKGPAFCAGADLRWMQQAQALGPKEGRADAAALDKLLNALVQAPQVFVAQVQGAAIGGGAGLVAACDMAVAGACATLSFSELSLGLVPAIIAPHVVRRLGAHKAAVTMMCGQRLTAAQAQQLGLIDHVVPDDELQQATDKLLAQLWRAGPQALAKTKSLLRALPQLTDQQQRDLCVDTLAQVRVTPEAQEGMAAFFARQEPSWRVP